MANALTSVSIRPHEASDHDSLVRLWVRLFPANQPRNDPVVMIRDAVVAFYRSIGYAVEERVSLGKILG